MTVVGTRHRVFPAGESPPHFLPDVIDVFRRHEAGLSVESLGKSFTQDRALAVVREDLSALGFRVRPETAPKGSMRSSLPFGVEMPPEDDPDYPAYRAMFPNSPYQFDAEHLSWHCRLEMLPNRGGRGTQLYRDLISCDSRTFPWLVLAVPNESRYRADGPIVGSEDYPTACRVTESCYAPGDPHLPVRRPTGVVVIGYGSVFAGSDS